jgi:hypothetical protein
MEAGRPVSAPHHSDPLANVVILSAFVSCWMTAGWSGKRAMREIKRRAKRKA